MYAHTCFVTSGRDSVFEPQTAANESLSFFGAKRPFFAFFMANAFFLPEAFIAVLPRRRFSAVIFFNVAFVTVVFLTVGLTVVVVIAIGGGGGVYKHALSLEP